MKRGLSEQLQARERQIKQEVLDNHEYMKRVVMKADVEKLK